MAIAYVYKGKVETHVLLTKNESWINSSHFHNILMKLERNTEIIYSMEVMSTTATTATKWQFRFTRGFMLVLKLKDFIVEPVMFWTFLNVHGAISKSLTFVGLSNLASH